MLNEIQFNSSYINMWLNSLNIFEKTQFKQKHLTQLICD